jgi:hypothetical protein
VALFEELATDPRTQATPRGTLRVWLIPPRFFVSRAFGYIGPEHVELFESYAEQCIRSAGTRKICAFHDWLDVTGYDSKVRSRLTSWSRQHLSAFDEVHMCIRSKIVSMGVQLVNIALNGVIRVHTERTRMEVELRRVLRSSSNALKI